MAWLALAWITLSPYFAGLAVWRSDVARRMIGRHLALAAAIGWSALAVLLAGVLVVSGQTGIMAALIAAPFGGLAFWIRRDGGGGDDGPPPEPPPEDVPPSGDRVDWDDFRRKLDDWSRERVPA